MKRVLNRIWSFGLAALMCLGITAAVNDASTEFVVADAETDYYAAITATGGNELLGQVHDLITTTHTYYSSYDNCRTASYVLKTDPGTNGQLMEFYTQENLSSTWQSGANGTWNREHVWCKSLSNGLWTNVSNPTTGGGADLYHIRPTETTLNSARGNNKYGEVDGGTPAYYKDTSGKNVAIGGYNKSSVFEPLDKVKGDVARIIMYVYTHYNTYSNVYGTTNGKGNSSFFGTLKFANVVSANSESAAIDLLLKWHNSDPVDQIEINRNDAVYSIQGNRNPFVDHPEYADYIWGDSTSVKLESLSLSPDSFTLSEGKNQTLTVTPYPSIASASVSWTSSNEAVAFVSENGVVTAKSAGTATITATSTVNPAIKVTAQVTVEKAKYSTANITLDSFNLTYGYGFKNWSAGGLNGIAYIYGGTSAYPQTGKMQFNTTQSSYYIASNTPATGPIKSVTVKSFTETADREWKLLTSNTPYGQVAGKPTNGNDQGTKTVTEEGTTWTLNGEDTYFALTYETKSGAVYLYSIIIEYGDEIVEEEHICGHVCDICGKCTDEVCQDLVCADKCEGHGGGEEINRLQEFHTAVEAIVTNGTLNTRLASINRAIAAYQALTDEEKALAQEDIATLQAAIADYNQTVNGYNKEAEKANNAATGRKGE